MAVSLTQGKQAYEISGLPASGSKIYTYAPGTLTPKSTYSDAAGTTPNANPTILDSRGEAVMFWDGAYKIIFTDAGGGTIWTVDGVTSGSSGSLTADVNGKYTMAAATAGTDTFVINKTGGAASFTVSRAGNVTIAAPNSGIALTVTGAAGLATASLGFVTIADTLGLATGGNIYTSSTNPFNLGTLGVAALRLYTNTIERINVSTTGAVTVNTPTSGVALIVTGAAGLPGGYVIVVHDDTYNSESGSSLYLRSGSVATHTGLLAGADKTQGFAYLQSIEPGTSFTSKTLRLNPNGGGVIIGTGANTTSFGSAGNVTIAIPSSGTPLNVNGSGELTKFTSTSARGSGLAYIALYDPTGIKGYFGYGSGASDKMSIVQTLNADFEIYTNNAGPRLVVGSAGNVTIAAPGSGVALAVTGLAGSNTANFSVSGNSTVRSASTSLNGVGAGFEAATSGQVWQFGVGYGDGTTTWNLYDSTRAAIVLKASLTGNITIPTPSSGDALAVSGSVLTPSVAVAFSATAMTLNTDLSNVFSTTFTANVTVAPTISNPSDGQTINWFITQDGTGSRTMTWPGAFKWPSGSAGILTTAAGAVDLLTATYRSATGFWYVSLLKAFA